MTDCIVWENSPDQIFNAGGNPTVTYSDVQDGWPGDGNIDADPMFVDAGDGDYRLLTGSPCIDAGDPDPDPDPECDFVLCSTHADEGAGTCTPFEDTEGLGACSIE